MDTLSMLTASALCLLALLAAPSEATRLLRGEDVELHAHSRVLLAADCTNPTITFADSWKPSGWSWNGGGVNNKRYAFIDASGKAFKSGTNVYWGINMIDAGKGQGKTLLVTIGWTQGMFYPGGIFTWRLYKGDVQTPANALCKNSKVFPNGAVSGGEMETSTLNLMALNYGTTKAGLTDQPFSNIVSCSSSNQPTPFMLVSSLVYTNSHAGYYFGRYNDKFTSKQICSSGQYFSVAVFNVKCNCGYLERGH